MNAPLADATTQVVMEEVKFPKFSANSTPNSTQSQTAGHHIPQSGPPAIPQNQQGYPSSPNISQNTFAPPPAPDPYPLNPGGGNTPYPTNPGGVDTPYPTNPTWVMPNQPYEPMSNNTPYPPH